MRLGLAAALAVGALYGAALVFLLEAWYDLTVQLPVQFDGIQALLGRPVVFSFAAFPAIAIAYQQGIRNGALAFSAILLTRLLAGWLGFTQPDIWALGVGLLMVFLAALRDQPAPSSSAMLPFADHLPRLRRRLPAVAGLGALYGLGAHQAVLVEGPQALLALAGGGRCLRLVCLSRMGWASPGQPGWRPQMPGARPCWAPW
jgi:hypothetical protein